MTAPQPTPVTVFAGYLGSGKTTIIVNLVEQMPKDYKIVWLKNEFGNIAVDSELAKEKNIAVKEMVNGCLCCILIGRLSDALNETIEAYHPDRIIIESSGSAYPAPIAWEIRKNPQLKLDGIVTVIDVLNFEGYKDKSITAKLQTQVNDLILLNKHELVDEAKLDKVMDDIYDLNPTTPKVKTDKGLVSPDLVFGLDTHLFDKLAEVQKEQQGADHHHHDHDVEILELKTDKNSSKEQWEQLLKSLPSESFFRIKGMINFEDGAYLLNYVFGRFEFEKLTKYSGQTQVTFMGRGLTNPLQQKICRDLGVDASTLKTV